MAPDTVAHVTAAADSEVMASVEEGETDTFVLADVTTDDAYITLPLEEAASLPAWR